MNLLPALKEREIIWDKVKDFAKRNDAFMRALQAAEKVTVFTACYFRHQTVVVGTKSMPLTVFKDLLGFDSCAQAVLFLEDHWRVKKRPRTGKKPGRKGQLRIWGYTAGVHWHVYILGNTAIYFWADFGEFTLERTHGFPELWDKGVSDALVGATNVRPHNAETFILFLLSFGVRNIALRDLREGWGDCIPEEVTVRFYPCGDEIRVSLASFLRMQVYWPQHPEDLMGVNRSSSDCPDCIRHDGLAEEAESLAVATQQEGGQR